MAAQSHRAAGVLLGQACGDALGVPYEFATPPSVGELAHMHGGGLGPVVARDPQQVRRRGDCT